MKCNNVFCVFNNSRICTFKDPTIGVLGVCEDVYIVPHLLIGNNPFRYNKELCKKPEKSSFHNQFELKNNARYTAKKEAMRNIDKYKDYILENKDKPRKF